MKQELSFVFSIIRAVVLNEPLPSEPENLDWEWIYKLCAGHNIANIIAYAKDAGKYQMPPRLDAEFSKKMFERLTVSENQNAEIVKLFKSFDENGIWYMPLKGILLQDLYPSRDMRFMADADILIRSEKKEELHKIMLGLGYEFKVESNHEYIYNKKPYVSVELHKYLIPTYNDDMYAYYGDGWKRAMKTANPLRFELSKEDNFIYIFAHFAKHYRDSGVGIKPIIDIWLYQKKFSVDMDYVKKQLKLLNLEEFFENTTKLIGCWFEGREFDEITALMTEFIINSGTFGNVEHQVSATAIRDYMDKDVSRAEKTRYIRAIFPNLKRMQGGYPVLRKFPFLLPVMWVFRIAKLLLFKRDKIEGHKKRVESVNTENIGKVKNHMSVVGLDIYNGRKK